jgi:hypothetical protein
VARSRVFLGCRHPITRRFAAWPQLGVQPRGWFRDFCGTMPPSDGLSLCLAGGCPWTAPGGLRCWQQADAGSPDSRAVCVWACVGSPTPPGRCSPRLSVRHHVAFRVFGPRRHPEVARLRGAIPRLHIPLSTRRRRRYRRRRMTRSQGGGRDLPWGELSSLTHCRFSSALSRTPGVSCCRKPKRGTSGGCRQSAHALVRQCVPLFDALAQVLRARLKLRRVRTQILPHV